MDSKESAGYLKQPDGKVGKVRQACDTCHMRRIRCDGMQPCWKCIAGDNNCTYNAVHKKTGPKGPRKSAKARAQKHGPSSQSKSDSQRPLTSPSGNQSSDATVTNPTSGSIPDPSSNYNASSLPAVSIDVITFCVDAFFKHKYPITPILDRAQVEAMILHLVSYTEQYALLTACCSVMVLNPELLDLPSSPPSADGQSRPYSSADLPSVDCLISETMKARSLCDWVEHPSLTSVQTSFFLFSAYFCLGKDNSAWFHLREAITILQTIRFHEESTYTDLAEDSGLVVYARRMFWVLFITERAYGLQRHRPLTLQETIALPAVNEGREKDILTGFLDLISLFRNFDSDFLNVWNLQSVEGPASSEAIVRLQDILQHSLRNLPSCTDNQKADLLLTRQWLKRMVWQLCVTKSLLSSTTDEESMSIAYPITIAREAVIASNIVPATALEANGVGIVEKLFDIGCSLADVLTLRPRLAVPVALEIGALDYLLELVRISGTVVGGSSRHLEILVSKVNDCLQTRASNGLQGLPQIWELDDDELGTNEEVMRQSFITADVDGWASAVDNMFGIFYSTNGLGSLQEDTFNIID
ncbi:hypothetical protein S7711_03640 [Stachybotrys chartarum IBT 7711]|uniref:Zn(2)-C6 fungal-type domain-containing protein n=1 Tax=Stachybotrys chartarum (strain CBS 109288 / IBT 7711) TaxID=1280523 RepID=A0A084AGZ9_STACB|nr:hypothetical protein S7711_03640 [Stachybotrys chartarum IBT 7711]